MAKAQAADMDMTLRGYVDDGEEVYHPIVLFEGIKYDLELEADDEDADLDLYITDEEGNILYEDESAESGAAAWFKPGYYGIHHLFIKSHEGGTDYTLTISE